MKDNEKLKIHRMANSSIFMTENTETNEPERQIKLPKKSASSEICLNYDKIGLLI